jgi:HTH-type transcriptional repressor of NAD biosynthesis genes
MTRGVVWGKFLPLHHGHVHLVTQALQQCDELVVVLGARRDEPYSRELREAWLRDTFPGVEVRAHWDDLVVDYDDPVVWDGHVAQLRSVVPEAIDLVFTSELYGEELARRVGARHVLVDLDRTDVPVSGTAVRGDLEGHWDLLPPAVRGSLCRRIVVVGAESTGTTTLATALAEVLGTTWVPEFGRQWSSDRPGGLEAPWATEEFDHVAATQAAMEDEAARDAPVPWLVCDTDVLATAVWHERYLGTRSRSVEALAAHRVPELYVLTRDDIPFEQDGMRDGEHLRPWMTQRFRQVLDGLPWIEVSGTVEERVEQVLSSRRQP